jgi:hypothetical protein
MPKRYTIEDCHRVAKERGGECLSTKYINSRAQCSWRCNKCGYEWDAPFKRIMEGRWCRECDIKRRALAALKYTIDDCHRIAKERGGKFISDEYTKSNTKYEWECKDGHVWSASFTYVRKGSWCKKCALKGRANCRKTIEDCNKLASIRGGKFLSKEYKNNRTKYDWRCKKGHIFSLTYENVKRGSWCRDCQENAPITIEDCRALAKKKGGKFLSEKYTGVDTKYDWECKKGHVFTTTYYSVKTAGVWCRDCRGIALPTIKTCHELAKKNGGKFLSKEYIRSDTKYEWDCGKGHVFITSYDCIKSGTWCPYCYGNLPKTIDDCCKLAASRGGKCLSTKYTNNRTKMKWQCKHEHEPWWAAYGNVNNGTWCPYCKLGKTQNKLYGVLKKIYFNAESTHCNYKEFEWLGRQEIDIFIKNNDFSIGIEYDGRQHFMPVDFFGGEDAYVKTQARDKRKNKLIAEHKDDVTYFIRVPYTEKINEKNIRKLLKMANIPMPIKQEEDI